MDSSWRVETIYGPSHLGAADAIVLTLLPSKSVGAKIASERLLQAFELCGIFADGAPDDRAIIINPTNILASLIGRIGNAHSLDGLELHHDVGRLVVLANEIEAAQLAVEAALLIWSFACIGSGLDAKELGWRLHRILGQLQELVPEAQLRAITQACSELSIPHGRFSARPRMIRIGEGRHRLLLDLTDTSKTKHLAARLAGDKVATSRILAANGIPVAKQVLVENPDQAWRAAIEIGLPVVVKAQRGNKGRGLTVKVRDRYAMNAAFAHAREIGEGVLVESYLPGSDFRVIVVGDKAIGVSNLPRPNVVGDGVSTISALVDRNNSERASLAPLIEPIQLGSDALALLRAEGLTENSVVESGRRIFLHEKSGRRLGSMPIYVGHNFHSDNAALAVRAVRLIGLDVGSIDFRTIDHTRSWREVGGGVCEVNSRSGIHAFLLAKPEWVKEMLIPSILGTSPRRIPHILVVGATESAARLDHLARALAQSLGQRTGWRLGLALGDGLWLDHYSAEKSMISLRYAYRRMVESPLLGAAIYCVTPDRVRGSGFGLRYADFALIDGTHPLADDDASRLLRAFVQASGAQCIEISQDTDPSKIAEEIARS